MTARHAFGVSAACAVAALSCSSPTAPQQAGQTPPPAIACPAPPAPVIAVDERPVPVAYGTAIATGGQPAVSVVCAPPSGASFPVGSTTVTCTASDALQRVATCTFDVVVSRSLRIALARFVAFGDSITAGENGDPSTPCGSNDNIGAEALRIRPLNVVPHPYPDLLETMLRARYAAQSGDVRVTNRGKGGETAGGAAGETETAVARFQRTLSEGSFEAVLLMEGSNDIFDGDGTKIDAAIQGLRAMVQEAKKRNVRPFVATVPPMVPGRDRSCGNRQVAPLNQRIRLLVAEQGVTLVDVFDGLGPAFAPYIGNDGLHPTEEGYARIADIFFGVLRAGLEVPAQSNTPLRTPVPLTSAPPSTPFVTAPRPPAAAAAPRGGPRR